ncbi:hypothetical protein J5X98_26970 [Leptothermofonsia sichuanensis E412]|jgi:hypothetical protein|uniref:DUF6812 domain-containing protein n=1 Tax=Leptothermofonsia sichuanensis TaxID=2917832 RepID=UPI001CA673C1|nr:hypothetical protein [Leptothermofonsia sichuanensis]QZZ20806.1 hypothetical protein J5X98_26970 [Leptothermofonsia sichuanensis E412]
MAVTPAREKHRVKIYTTDQWEIQGDISIPVGGYNARLSDFLNNDNTFIALTNAVVYGTDGKLLANESFLSVNKQAIKLVIEESSDSTEME